MQPRKKLKITAWRGGRGCRGRGLGSLRGDRLAGVSPTRRGLCPRNRRTGKETPGDTGGLLDDRDPPDPRLPAYGCGQRADTAPGRRGGSGGIGSEHGGQFPDQHLPRAGVTGVGQPLGLVDRGRSPLVSATASLHRGGGRSPPSSRRGWRVVPDPPGPPWPPPGGLGRSGLPGSARRRGGFRRVR